MKARAALLAGSVLLTVPVMSGCAGGAITCSGKANNVHQSNGTPSDMVGKATGTCNAVVEVTGYVEIQRYDNTSDRSRWRQYARSDFSLTTIPGKQFTRQAAAKCAKGTFRTFSEVTGTYKGQSETRDDASDATTNPCG
jgi:hypothetical protein